jgi:hypothetical protein
VRWAAAGNVIAFDQRTDWMFRHIFLLVLAQAGVAEFLKTFKEFPSRKKASQRRSGAGKIVRSAVTELSGYRKTATADGWRAASMSSASRLGG